MSKDGYYGDFDSFSDEQRAYQEWSNSQQQEPDVVPCFKCSLPMYTISNVPEQNICEKCKAVVEKVELVSNCCSAPVDDFDICTHCKEGCEAVQIE